MQEIQTKWGQLLKLLHHSTSSGQNLQRVPLNTVFCCVPLIADIKQSLPACASQ